MKQGRGALVELVRAIPVPDQEVPLAEVLELKLKRKDELLAVRFELDSFYSEIAISADPEFELRRKAQRVDEACADLLKVADEWRFPVKLADVKASFEWSAQAAVPAFLALFAGNQYELPTVATALGTTLGAAIGLLKVSGDIVVRSTPSKRKEHPFRYVYSIHNELFERR